MPRLALLVAISKMLASKVARAMGIVFGFVRFAVQSAFGSDAPARAPARPTFRLRRGCIKQAVVDADDATWYGKGVQFFAIDYHKLKIADLHFAVGHHAIDQVF